MHRLRRPHSASAPPPPSASALIAASTAYHPTPPAPSLAALAAGAALRQASASPPPASQRPGTIPTKRMVVRRGSYSTPDRPPMSRRSSSGSLTERRFRKSQWSSGSSTSSAASGGSGTFGRSASLRSFPDSMRGGAPSRKKAASGGSVLSRGSLRRAGEQAQAREYTDSIRSLTPSLDSISESRIVDRVPTRISEDSEDDLPHKVTDTTTLSPKTTAHDTTTSLSPTDPRPSSRATFAPNPTLSTPPKHTPPARSVSPAKSALKNAPHSEAGSVRRARVSFSDEDSIASFSAYTRPPIITGLGEREHLPTFGSVRASSGGVLAPSPPPSSSGTSEDGISVVRWPRGPPLGPKKEPESRRTVPELVLIMPTPGEEKLDLDLPGGFPSPEDTDSDSGESIYSDAHEELPSMLTPTPPMANILEVVPLSAVRGRATDPHTPHPDHEPTPTPQHPPEPPLSPCFLNTASTTPTSETSHPSPLSRPPVSAFSSSSDSDSDADDESVSSFVRAPREKRPMMQSMRSSTPSGGAGGGLASSYYSAPPRSSTGGSVRMPSSMRGSGGASRLGRRIAESDSESDTGGRQVEFQSRWAGDSDDEDAGKKKKGGFWSVFRKKKERKVTRSVVVAKGRRGTGMEEMMGARETVSKERKKVAKGKRRPEAVADAVPGERRVIGVVKKELVVPEQRNVVRRKSRGSRPEVIGTGEKVAMVENGAVTGANTGVNENGGPEKEEADVVLAGVMAVKVEAAPAHVKKHKFGKLRRMFGIGT